MIRNFFKHLLESLKNLRRNGWMTIAAISSVMITLILVGIFSTVILNTMKLSNGIANNVRVVAYVKLNVHDQSATIPDPHNAAKTVKNADYQKVYNAINEIPNVKKVTFSSKDEQFKELTASLGKSWQLAQGDSNPLYDAYIIEADQTSHVEQVASAVKKITGVQTVNYGGNNTKNIFAFARTVQIWGSVGAVLLLLVAVFLISNTIRITIISRQREIQIMRLVGAKNGYIRWPFFLEGAWVGLIGAIIPSILIWWVYGLAYTSLKPALHMQDLSMYPRGEFTLYMVIALFVIGILIGSIGAILSMRRYLKA